MGGGDKFGANNGQLSQKFQQSLCTNKAPGNVFLELHVYTTWGQVPPQGQNFPEQAPFLKTFFSQYTGTLMVLFLMKL